MYRIKIFFVFIFLCAFVLVASNNEIKANSKRVEVSRDEYSITYKTGSGYESEYSNVPVSLKDDKGNWQNNNNNFEKKGILVI